MPQGGVIFPLPANIYLNVLDRLWKGKKIEEKMEARLIRYAGDCAAQKAEYKNLTYRKPLGLPTAVVIRKFNQVVRGWVAYFYYGNCSRDSARMKALLEERVRIYLRRKHGQESRGYKKYPARYLYETLELYKIPMTAPWTQTAKAFGGR